MKKLLFLLMLLTGMVNAQPLINNPTDFIVCDVDNSGSQLYFYSTKKSEILNGLDPFLYSIKNYNSLSDSQLNINVDNNQAISITGNTTIFIRVYENLNPSNFALTTLNLIFSPAVYANSVGYIAQPDIPFDGHSVFDLSTKSSAIIGIQINCNVVYYTSYTDAVTNNNPIINETNYTNITNPQIIYAKVINAGGCIAITNFNLVLSNPNILFIPDYELKNMLVNINSLYYGSPYAGLEPPYAKDLNNITVPIDSNNDGEIQITEALNISNLNIIRYPSNQNIKDATGLEMFINLTKLNLSKYNLSTLNFSGFEGLTELKCSNSNLTNLNTNAFQNLTTLDCNNNSITSLNLTNNPQLGILIANNNQLTSLNIDNNFLLSILNVNQNQLINLNVVNNTALQTISCNNNNISALNTSLLSNLTELDISYNNINNIDLNNNINLVKLNCSNNQLNNLNTSTLVNLNQLNCSNNLLPSLNLTNLNNLSELGCGVNLLNTIDLSLIPNLNRLDCSSNQLTQLDLSLVPNLTFLNCSNNQIITLDVTTLIGLTSLYCNSTQISVLDFSKNLFLNNVMFQNNDLRYVNFKNGKNDSVVFYSDAPFFGNNPFINNPNLDYICIDAVGEGNLVGYLSQANLSTSIVNSYCSFLPGGDYNIINGIVKLDANNNGCDVSDLPQPNIRLNINDGTTTGASFTSDIGNYNFFTQAGSFDVTPEIENPTFFNFTPATATIPFANNNNTATQDFCISANGIHPDLEVVLAPITPARPGFDATYQLVYKNKGNQTLSGVVNLVFDDAKTDFISANPAVDNLAVNSLSWNYSNLLPFEGRSIYITLNVNSPQETPAVTIGDMLNFSTSITSIVGDELPLDNTFTYNQTVVGSFDPNTIECLEGTSVSPSEIGNYLHYVINFENTGNYPAENVVVKTIIDPAKFDINSLQLLNTSNPVDARITGNVVEFIFKNVQLAGPGGHGHVLLKVKSINSLISGDSVANRADIFFDYNAPVDTGLETTIFQSLSNSVFVKDDSINVLPNPTNGNVTINSNFNIKNIEVYDVQGRILQTILNSNKLDISEKANGIYFLKITTEKGGKIEKLVKD